MPHRQDARRVRKVRCRWHIMIKWRGRCGGRPSSAPDPRAPRVPSHWQSSASRSTSLRRARSGDSSKAVLTCPIGLLVEPYQA